MHNQVKISEALFGITGLRQPFNPEYAILEPRNTECRSGLYVTDNAYAKVEFLKDTQDYEDISDADFNDFIADMQKSSISKVVAKVFNKADYFDRNLIYSYAGQRVETDILPNGFVGYKIKVSNEKNVAFKISRILLDFEGTGAIELMLFNTSQRTPLFTKEITITSDHQSEKLDWSVDNSGATYKGDYYLGYISTGISVQPFKRNYEESIQMNWFTYLEIAKVYVLNHTTNQLFDIRTVAFMNEDTGLNPDITVFEDFTDLIINNEALFAQAIFLEFAISFISRFASSLRSNRNQRITNELISRAVMEIEGSGSDGVIKGLRPVYSKEIARLTEEINKLKEGYFGGPIQVYTQS